MSETASRHRGIVVAVDGSPASDAAVVWAAHDAALRNVPLTVVHAVVTPTATWPPAAYPESLAVRREDEGKRAILDAIKLAEEAMPADRKVAIERELMFANPTSALIELSGEAEMIVMGTAGHGVLARGVLGSVSSTVARQAHCPVAVVHGNATVAPDAPVLVGVDGSQSSERATAIAFDEASRRGVDLIALHAWSDLAVTADLPELDWASVEAAAERSLAESLAGWQEQFPDVTVRRLVVRDRPGRQLAEQAESAQLLVVGSHGRGGLAGALLGSVSNSVLQHVQTPVIVARTS